MVVEPGRKRTDPELTREHGDDSSADARLGR
jgi:hypothetical protein